MQVKREQFYNNKKQSESQVLYMPERNKKGKTR